MTPTPYPELATCSVREYRAHMGVPAPICEAAAGVIPRERPLDLLHPSSGRHDTMDLATHADLYKRQLAKLQTSQVERALHLALVGVRPARPLVLLCVCWLGNPATLCHRTLFALWWQTRTGQRVPELGDTPLALWGGSGGGGGADEPVPAAGGRDFPPAIRRD